MERSNMKIQGVVVGLTLVVFAIYCVALLHTYHGGSPLVSLADDFFYYAEIARRYLQVHYMTFDGTTPTNGYHPLWMWLLTGLLRVCGTSFLPAVLVVTALSIAATFPLCFVFLKRAGLGDAPAVAFAMAGTAVAATVEVGAMESVVAIPAVLVLGIYAQRRRFDTARSWFGLGLLCSLAILCRLDSLLFVGMLVGWEWLLAGRERWRRAVPLGAGLLPLVIYFMRNRLVFGAFMTVSSRAKQLTVGFHPTLLPLVSAFGQLLGIVYLYTLVGIMLLLTERGRADRLRPVYASAILFPWLQIGVLCVVSDWPLEFWYSYSLVLASLATSVLLVRRFGVAERVGLVAGTVAALAMLGAVSGKKFHRPVHDSIGGAAAGLAAWSATHPGAIAMGDRAGKVGWLSPEPLLQLEGLVEDEAYLKRVRAQEDVVAVMKEYGVRYYIASTSEPAADHCYHVLEPGRAGEYAAKLHAVLCAAPVFVFQDKLLAGEVPDCCTGMVSRVFDLDELVQDDRQRWVARLGR